ncbi:tartrate-resistant acid phosphatase type 5-like isoform X2 [Dysidea avara]|uniref:tartrate-resistant acid phosphatase type 5-like isoform X2 n=2 Tax=Dysidea avara TaxID=196820 RepID=UPI00331A8787
MTACARLTCFRTIARDAIDRLDLPACKFWNSSTKPYDVNYNSSNTTELSPAAAARSPVMMSHYYSVNEDDDVPVLNKLPQQEDFNEHQRCCFNRRCFLPFIIIIIALLFVMVIATITLAVTLNSNNDDGEANYKLSFLVVGDWGGKSSPPYYTPAQKSVALQMGRTAEEINSQFTVSLGDNFYKNGVTDEDDPRFNTTFESVFTAESLQPRWYIIAGNHDHNGNVSAQIEYTKKSHRWYMPNYYYTEIIRIPDSGVAVQFVFIDTELLTRGNQACLQPATQDSQWTWIENTLAASIARWLFVLGHHPVWSIDNHGPTQVLVDCLRPLLIKYKVTAYFCGHDHTMQHIHEEDSSVEYFVSGAGHSINPSQTHVGDVPPQSLLFHYGSWDPFKTRGAFAYVSVYPAIMNVTYVDYKGNELYFYSKEPTRK